MNDLQKLIALRGLTVLQIAEDLGQNYHSVQKTIKGVRIVLSVKPLIAGYLQIDEAQAWGPRSRKYLRKLIAEEIDRCAARERASLRRRYLRGNGESIPDRKKAGNA